MKRTLVALALVLVGIALWLWWRPGTKKPDVPAAAQSAATPTPAAQAAAVRRTEAPSNLRVLADDDVAGTLRLEGQVIDADDAPVGGATVWLSSNPPRTTVSEQDGAFSFDSLVARQYSLVASAEEGVAGPVTARLNDRNEPVILRLRAAASLEVHVVTAGTRQPVAGATVQVRGLLVRSETTDAGGVAHIASLPPDGYEVVAQADGYANASAWTRVRAVAVSEKLELMLQRGGPVSGRVVDPDGKPVSGARVVYEGASDWAQRANPDFDAVLTDAAGAFHIAALSAGTFRFRARHSDFAPGLSELITLDGSTERSGVVIQLEAGAALAGRVVTAQGEPAPAAAVRVAVEGEGRGFDGPSRQTYTDARGQFEMRALPRRGIAAVAVADGATSDTMRIDLQGVAEKRDVELRLDVDGRIAGTVVDGKGEPVDGAQVTAFPDFRRGAGMRSQEDWQLRGLATELTDASGAFEFRGLKPGPYRLGASPPGRVGGWRRPWGRAGTDADLGDIGVEIVLELGGGVKGKVALANGDAPEMFTVSVGRSFGPFGGGDGVPFANRDGSFELPEVPPGTHTLIIRGAGFEQRRVPDIEVASDRVTDVGTITVQSGRSIAGRVVTSVGDPVAGAKVLAGRRLFGGGTNNQSGGGFRFGGGNTEETTDENGAFVIRGIGRSSISVMAEHETYGRTAPVTIPVSDQSILDLTLVMAAPGALEGAVTMAGRPAADVRVSCQSRTAPAATFSVGAGPDGRFRFDRLAPDQYLVTAMARGNPMRGMAFHSGTQVTIESGKTAQVTLAIEQGTASLRVELTPADGGAAGMAFVSTVQAAITATTASELEQQTANREGGFSGFALAFPDRPLVVPDLMPGQYSVCAVPFPRELQSPPELFGYMGREGDRMRVFCVQVTVEPGAVDLPVRIPVEVPAFVPDPDGKG